MAFESGFSYTNPGPDKIDRGDGGRTYDTARGGGSGEGNHQWVKYWDAFNIEHKVWVNKTKPVLNGIWIPISNGELRWTDADGGMERTGFNAADNWCCVNFAWQAGGFTSDPSCRMTLEGWRSKGIAPDSGWWGDYNKVKGVAGDVIDLAGKLGIDPKDLAKAAGLLG